MYMTVCNIVLCKNPATYSDDWRFVLQLMTFKLMAPKAVQVRSERIYQGALFKKKSLIWRFELVLKCFNIKLQHATDIM